GFWVHYTKFSVYITYHSSVFHQEGFNIEKENIFLGYFFVFVFFLLKSRASAMNEGHADCNIATCLLSDSLDMYRFCGYLITKNGKKIYECMDNSKSYSENYKLNMFYGVCLFLFSVLLA
ncbi:hypothetical protein ACJX0J_019749, partial [Zea mays]